MNKAQFRWLLIAYVVVLAMTVIPELYRHLVIPDVVLKLEPAFATESTSFTLLKLIYLLLSLGAGLIGIIGMFCLWRPGRYFFLLGVAMKIFSFPLFLSWGAATGWSIFFTDIELLLDGTILTLAMFGPAKYLFPREKSG